MSGCTLTIVLLIWQLACGPYDDDVTGDSVAPPLADSADGDTALEDTASRDSGSPDTRPVDTADPLGCDGDIPEAPSCSLTQPGPVEASTFDALHALAFAGVFPKLYSLGDDPGCPLLTMEGPVEVWSGGCSTADGRTYEGSARLEPRSPGPVYTETFEQFVETGDTHRYAIDGTRTTRVLDYGTDADYALELSIEGSDDETVPDGSRALHGRIAVNNSYVWLDLIIVMEGRDWCLREERGFWNSGCGSEENGAAVVVGERTATWVEQPYPECDGCACFDPADAEPELYCRG